MNQSSSQPVNFSHSSISNVLFISHGGGPLPLLGDKGHKEMVSTLKEIASEIKKPDAILIISAHWEEQVPTVTAAKSPDLIYDYYGFPKESYEIKYPCGGEPQLAKQVYDALAKANIEVELDNNRGLDHGVFVPMTIMYPKADIPCVQLSLASSLDPDLHINVGEALQGLDYENLLVIGSGFSFHNLREFFSQEVAQREKLNLAFESWLMDVMTNPNYSEAERTGMLSFWEQAPGARYCHPREEHLLPLHVCYGLAKGTSQKSYLADILGVKSSMYLW